MTAQCQVCELYYCVTCDGISEDDDGDVLCPDCAGDKATERRAEKAAELERMREEALYQGAQRVYDEEDRSPDSDDGPERPEF